MVSLESTNDDGDTTDQTQCTSPTSRHGQTALSVSQAEKFVELQFDSKFYRINIMEPLEICVSSDDRLPANKRCAAIFAKYEQVCYNLNYLFCFQDSRPSTEIVIPKASYTMIDSIEPQRKSSSSLQQQISSDGTYIKYKEKSAAELDQMVEYDMDEEVGYCKYYDFECRLRTMHGLNYSMIVEKRQNNK